MYYDLHVHSRASDGVLSGPELLDQACQMGLPGIAITDHDTVGELPVAVAYREGEQLDLVLIPGIELNTEVDEGEIHILGYFIDYCSPILLSNLQQIKAARYERARRMVARLRDMGYMITFEQVKNLARGELIARSHVAMALIENGYVGSIREAFHKHIGRGRPAYVPRYKFTPQRALELIKAAGGISVLAHPGLVRQPQMVEAILEMGVEGLEAFYPEHSKQDTEHFLALAKRRGLLVTGGSDFHGTGGDITRNRLGCCGINAEYMGKLCNYYQRKAKNIINDL